MRDTQTWSSVGKRKPVASVAACVGAIARLKEMGWLEVWEIILLGPRGDKSFSATSQASTAK